MMKRLTITVAAALMFTPACAPRTTTSVQPNDSLVGAWRMTSLEVGSGPGGLQPVPYSGQIVFTDAGTMSVQAMDPAPNPPPSPYTLNGYEAFYGTVDVDYATNTFVVTVESSAVRNLIGQKMHRRFQVSGNRLVLTPANPQEGFRVTYERYSR